MEENNNNKSTAALIHLSTFSQYIIPFGNFIFPMLIWSAKKEQSNYIDEQGKRTINFQLSLFLYSLVMSIIAIPILLVTILKNFSLNDFSGNHDFNSDDFDFQNFSGIITFALITVFLFCLMKVFEFFLTIYAAVKTSNGEDFKYPLTINFLK